jgi:hypothetical protein
MYLFPCLIACEIYDVAADDEDTEGRFHFEAFLGIICLVCVAKLLCRKEALGTKDKPVVMRVQAGFCVTCSTSFIMRYGFFYVFLYNFPGVIQKGV